MIEKMEITDIQEQKKDKGRVSLFLDHKFWLGMSFDLFQELGIKKGEAIDSEKKESIEKLAEADHAFYWSLKRLSYKHYSKKQLGDKLREKGYPEEIIQATLKRCLDLVLLDDTLFAETVASERKAKGQGRIRVDQYLKQSGIGDKLRDQVLESTFPKDEEAEEARNLMQNKYEESLDPTKARQAYAFLVRRGFSSATARQVIEEAKMTQEEMDLFYGSKKALELLEKKWPDAEQLDQEKAWRFLLYRGFRSEDIKRALDLYSSSR